MHDQCQNVISGCAKGGWEGRCSEEGVPYWAQYSADKIGDYPFQMDLQGFHLSALLVVGLHMLDCHRQCEPRQRIHNAVVA